MIWTVTLQKNPPVTKFIFQYMFSKESFFLNRLENYKSLYCRNRMDLKKIDNVSTLKS